MMPFGLDYNTFWTVAGIIVLLFLAGVFALPLWLIWWALCALIDWLKSKNRSDYEDEREVR